MTLFSKTRTSSNNASARSFASELTCVYSWSRPFAINRSHLAYRKANKFMTEKDVVGFWRSWIEPLKCVEPWRVEWWKRWGWNPSYGGFEIQDFQMTWESKMNNRLFLQCPLHIPTSLELSARIIFLVRDPRAMAYSRFSPENGTRWDKEKDLGKLRNICE